MARTASTRAISYFAFRCYSEIVANAPPGTAGPSVASLAHLSRFLHGEYLLLAPPPPSPAVAARSSQRRVLVPAASYPTRCFINENEGASYIFLTRARTRPALVPPSLFLSIAYLFFPTPLFPFSPDVLTAERERRPYIPRCVFLLSVRRHFSSLLAAVILLSVYRTGPLSGECDNELCAKLIQTGITHASVSRVRICKREVGERGRKGKKPTKKGGNKNSEQRRSDSKTEVITAKIAVGFDVGFH